MSIQPRVLVSHELKSANTGNPDLDRKLAEWQREHVSQVFERLRYHAQYSPDHEQTEAEITAEVTPADYRYPPGHLYRYKSGSVLVDDTNDWAPALQAAIDQYESGGDEILVPHTSGYYRCDSAVTVSVAIKIRGMGKIPGIYFYGCDGFVFAAGCVHSEIQNLTLTSLSAGGSVDPKTHIGIDINGASGNSVNFITLRKVYLRGWATCLDWSYTWNSVIDDCSTINCTTGIRLFGQSVNNQISNSRIVANSGTYCIRTVKDGSTIGEGLDIVNTLLAEGDYAVHSDGFLSMNCSNVVADLIEDTAFDLQNCPAFNLSSCWVYSTNYGVRFRDLSVPVDQQCSIGSTRIEVTAANAKAVLFGANNTGLAINGGTLIGGPSGTARCVYIEATGCDDVAVYGTNCVNPTGNASIFVGSQGFRYAGLIGNDTVEYYTGAPNAYTGTWNGGTTSPTGTIRYSVQGDTVTLEVPQVTATSANTTLVTITGMPANLAPAVSQNVIGVTVDNSASVISNWNIDTSGTLTLQVGVTTTATNGNTKGSNSCTVTFRRF